MDSDEEQFREKLRRFFVGRGQQMPKVPNVGGSTMKLAKLFRIVNNEFGGSFVVTAERKWKLVVAHFNFPASCTSASFILRQNYERFLLDYEKLTYGSAHKYAPGGSHSAVAAAMVTAPAPSKPYHAYAPPIGSSTTSHAQLHSQAAGDRASLAPHTTSVALPATALDYSGLHRLGRGGCVQHLPYALQCGLPNEADWAVNALLMLSADEHGDKGPRLLRDSPLLLDIVVPMVVRWLRGACGYEMEGGDGGLFGGRGEDVAVARVERGLAVMVALRNLTMWEDSAAVMARSKAFLSLLARLLDSSEKESEGGAHLNTAEGRAAGAHQLAVDCAVNVARFVSLGDKSHAVSSFAKSLLSFVSAGLASADRSQFIAAVSGIAALCEGDEGGNAERLEKVLGDADVTCITRALLVPDARIVIPSLEALYRCTFLSPTMARRMCGDPRVVADLVRLALFDQGSFDCDAAIAPAGNAFGDEGNDECAWESGASSSDALRAMIHWIHANFEQDATGASSRVDRVDMYRRYVASCAAAGVPHQNASAFAAAAHSLFPSLASSSSDTADGWTHTYRGIRDRHGGDAEWHAAWSEAAGDSTTAQWDVAHTSSSSWTVGVRWGSVDELMAAYAAANVGVVSASVRFTASLVLRNIAREPLCQRHLGEHATILAVFACTQHSGASALADCVGELM